MQLSTCWHNSHGCAFCQILDLSVAAEFGQAGFNRFAIIRIAIPLAVVFAFNAMIGAAISSALSPTLFTIVVSFGLAALLYLVTEELLLEAHETPDTLLSTTTFFAGFLVLLVISIVTRNGRYSICSQLLRVFNKILLRIIIYNYLF
jgi:hypothetical protein